MVYAKATLLGLLVFVAVQVLLFWKIIGIKPQTATGIGALQVLAWRSIPLGLLLFAVTVVLTLKYSH